MITLEDLITRTSVGLVFIKEDWALLDADYPVRPNCKVEIIK